MSGDSRPRQGQGWLKVEILGVPTPRALGCVASTGVRNTGFWKSAIVGLTGEFNHSVVHSLGRNHEHSYPSLKRGSREKDFDS